MPLKILCIIGLVLFVWYEYQWDEAPPSDEKIVVQEDKQAQPKDKEDKEPQDAKAGFAN